MASNNLSIPTFSQLQTPKYKQAIEGITTIIQGLDSKREHCLLPGKVESGRSRLGALVGAVGIGLPLDRASVLANELVLERGTSWDANSD